MMSLKISFTRRTAPLLLGMFLSSCAGDNLDQDRETEFRALLTKGQAYMERNKPQQALPALREAQKIHPDNPDLLLTIATAYAKLGQSQAALEAMIKANEIKPNDPNIRHNLGVAYLQEGDLDHAESTLAEAAAMDFDNRASAWHNLALVYQQQGQTEKRVAALRQALDADPSHIPSHVELATFFNQSNQPDQERTHLEKIVALVPDDSEILERLGNNLANNGRTNQAKAIFRRLIRLDSDHPVAQRARRRLLEIEQP